MSNSEEKSILKELETNIFNGDFDKAKELSKTIPADVLEEELIGMGFISEDMGTYLFVQYLLLEEESAYLHGVASALMSLAYVSRPGAYYVAYRHMLRAVELDTEDYTYKEGLLLFYHIPDQLLSKEKAIEMANEILKVCPDNVTALNILGKGEPIKEVDLDFLNSIL